MANWQDAEAALPNDALGLVRQHNLAGFRRLVDSAVDTSGRPEAKILAGALRVNRADIERAYPFIGEALDVLAKEVGV